MPDHAVLTRRLSVPALQQVGEASSEWPRSAALSSTTLSPILRAKRPPVVMLENVRNIAGPRQSATWQAVVAGLRTAGYQVSDRPLVFSPHLLSPADGGAPQIRERVYILGVHVGEAAMRAKPPQVPLENRPQNGWDPERWSIAEHGLLPEPVGAGRSRYAVTSEEEVWLNTWNELLARLGPNVFLPGFPLWEPIWRVRRPSTRGLPLWKDAFIRKNHEFYLGNRVVIDQWRRSNPQIATFPNSRRKFEWQAQDGPRDLWRLLLHMRPSGIRAKRPTYAPALVAMNQSSIYGPARRRLTPLEAARLQGFDEQFSFGAQTDALSYKQMGNAVNVGAARYVFRRFVEANDAAIRDSGALGAGVVDSVLADERWAESAEQTA